MSATALAAQRAQGRVFTNDDIETSPPPAAASSEAAGEARPAAAAPAVQPADQDAPSDDLKKLLALRDALGQASDELNAKIQQERDQSRIDRWRAMNDCLASVLREYQTFIDELQARQSSSARQ